MVKQSFRKSMMSSAIAMALMGVAAPSSAIVGVLFDPTGAAPGGPVAAVDFNWIQNTVMVESGVFASTKASVSAAGEMTGQGLLTSIDTAGGGNANGPTIANQFTYVFGIDATVSRDTPNVLESKIKISNNNPMPAAPTTANYFYLYANAPTAAQLSSGTATFNTGTLILSGVITLDNNSSQPQLPGAPGTVVGGQGTSFSIGSNANSTTPQPIANGTPGGATSQGGNPIMTYTTSGSVVFDVKVTSFDTNYFLTAIDAVAFDLTLNSATYFSPFQPGINQTYVPGNVAGAPINFGDGTSPLNDFSCGVSAVCDYIAGTSSNKSGLIVNDSFVPEPGTLALLGLGLAGLGGFSRRKRS